MSDTFTEDLQKTKQELTTSLTTKKAEVSRLDADQARLFALIEAEKHTSASHDHHKNHHAPSTETRADIVKNEIQFETQAKKLDVLKKEIHHLEDELKSTSHDLHVVEASA